MKAEIWYANNYDDKEDGKNYAERRMITRNTTEVLLFCTMNFVSVATNDLVTQKSIKFKSTFHYLGKKMSTTTNRVQRVSIIPSSRLLQKIA